MRIATSWRLGSLWVFLPAMLLVGQLFTRSVFPSGEGYPLADQVRAFGSIALIYPILAASAAIGSARLKNSAALSHPLNSRRPEVTGLNLVLSHTLIGFLVTIVTITVYSFTMTGPSLVSWPLALCALIGTLAYALLGAALGLAIPAILAAPLAVVAPYILIAIPPALDVPWLRHLTSVNTSCCTIDQSLSTRAVAAFVVFHVSLSAISLAVISISISTPKLTRKERLPAPVIASIFLAAAILVAQPLPYGPVNPRQGNPPCQPTAGVELCLWPEHASSRAIVAPLLNKARVIASQTGVDLPTRLVERPQSASAWPSALVDLPPGDQPSLAADVVGALFPSSASCASSDPNAAAVADPTGAGSSPLVARMWWKWRLIGDPQDPGTDPVATKTFHDIQHLAPRVQGARINALSRDYRTFCRMQH